MMALTSEVCLDPNECPVRRIQRWSACAFSSQNCRVACSVGLEQDTCLFTPTCQFSFRLLEVLRGWFCPQLDINRQQDGKY